MGFGVFFVLIFFAAPKNIFIFPRDLNGPIFFVVYISKCHKIEEKTWSYSYIIFHSSTYFHIRHFMEVQHISFHLISAYFFRFFNHRNINFRSLVTMKKNCIIKICYDMSTYRYCFNCSEPDTNALL